MTNYKKYFVLLIAVLSSASFLVTPIVRADKFDDQINSLQQQNNQKQSKADQLGVAANSLQGTINKLAGQIDALQRQIDGYNKKVKELNKKIAEQEAELEQQRKVLGENIRAMYLEGDISTIEMLASSKDLSDFLDKQEYRNAVQDKIKNSVDTITNLKNQLKAQKDEIQAILSDKKNAQDDLQSQKDEKDHLLSLNQSQQDSLNKQIQSNYAKITDLRAQQAAINAAHFSGYTIVAGHNGNDTYPNVWRNADQDTIIDSWGMYNRECVSYTAWKVASTGHHMPYWGGRGNANEWPANARAAHIPVDDNPRAGDIAIAYWGSFGHAMYVTSVNDDGTINISQYNWDYHGHYSEIYHFNPSGLSFIHFR